MNINDDNEYRFVEKTLKAATMSIRDDEIAPRIFTIMAGAAYMIIDSNFFPWLFRK